MSSRYITSYEFVHYPQGGLGKKDGLIVLSHSGGTQAAIQSAELARKAGAYVVAITDVATSGLAKASDKVLLGPGSLGPGRGGTTSPAQRQDFSVRGALRSRQDIAAQAHLARPGGQDLCDQQCDWQEPALYHIFVADRVDGGYVADLPGLCAVGFWNLEEETVKSEFEDVQAYVAGCRFRDCTHVHEPGCAVRAAIQSGLIEERRYEEFLKVMGKRRRPGSANPLFSWVRVAAEAPVPANHSRQAAVGRVSAWMNWRWRVSIPLPPVKEEPESTTRVLP